MEHFYFLLKGLVILLAFVVGLGAIYLLAVTFGLASLLIIFVLALAWVVGFISS